MDLLIFGRGYKAKIQSFLIPSRTLRDRDFVDNIVPVAYLPPLCVDTIGHNTGDVAMSKSCSGQSTEHACYLENVPHLEFCLDR